MLTVSPIQAERPPIIGNALICPPPIRFTRTELDSSLFVQLGWGKHSWGLGFGLGRSLAPVTALIGRSASSPERGDARAPSGT